VTAGLERSEPEIWVDEGPVRTAAQSAVDRAEAGAARSVGSARATGPARVKGSPRHRPRRLPGEVAAELERAVGPRQAPHLAERLDAARSAFERQRFEDASRMLARLAREAPGAAAVRELRGLTFYRLEKWRAAATELEAYRALTGAVDQNPVLADCYRALGRYRRVDDLWAELRTASPSAALVAEGRIVAAGAKADQGDLQGAIALLERSTATPKRIRDHHLRQWYVLADLYDRVGDTPRARSLFSNIQRQSPGFADVEERLVALGS
jgi:tetratricopeptide (TPR) repeat protein